MEVLQEEKDRHQKGRPGRYYQAPEVETPVLLEGDPYSDIETDAIIPIMISVPESQRVAISR